MTKTKVTALALLLAAAAGCARCAGGRSAASAEELLAPGTPLSAATGALGALAQRASALADRAAQIPGAEQLVDLRRQLAAQLGFDPFTREGQLSAGLDPDRGAAFVATLPDGPQGRPAWVLALPLTSADKFTATADKLLRERSGFPLRTEEPRGDAKAIVFSRAGRDGKPAPGPRVAYAIVRGYGLLARGNDPGAEIGAAAQRKAPQSLSTDAGFSRAREPLPPAQGPAGDILVFAPAGSALGSRVAGRPLGGDSAVAVALQPQSLQLRLRAALPKEAHAQLQALLPGGGGELLSLLPPQAPLTLRMGLKPAEVAPQLERVPALRSALAALRAEVAKSGVDLDKDLFGALKPGIAAAVGVAPTLQLSRTVDFGLLDWRQQSPFDSVQLAALAEVADKARLLKALDAVAQAMPKVGAQAARAGDGWQVTYAAGAGARFGVREVGGRTLAYLVGGGVAPESLGQGASSPPDPALAGSQGLAVLLDLGKLAAALRALPESTYGTGPQSYIARSLVGQVVEPLKPLRASLQLQPTPTGLQATAQLEILASPGTAPQNRSP